MACSSKGANDRRINQYEKITSLDDLVADLIKLSDISLDVDQFGVIPHGDFMDTVDLEGPHKWLESHMHIVEKRYAYTVTELLKQKISLNAIQEVVYQAGKEIADPTTDLEQAYSYFSFNYLDGMPCDQTVDAYLKNDTVVMDILEDSHKQFWDQVGGDYHNYYLLLESYVRGLLPAMVFHADEKQLTLSKRV